MTAPIALTLAIAIDEQWANTPIEKTGDPGWIRTSDPQLRRRNIKN
jgi:hypothetical protein